MATEYFTYSNFGNNTSSKNATYEELLEELLSAEGQDELPTYEEIQNVTVVKSLDDAQLNVKKGSEHRSTITDITSKSPEKNTQGNRAKTPQPFHSASETIANHIPSRANNSNPTGTLPLPKHKEESINDSITLSNSNISPSSSQDNTYNSKEVKLSKTSTLPVKIRDPQLLRQLTSDGKAEKPITRQATDINTNSRRPTEGMPKMVVSISLADDSQTYKFMVTADFTVVDLANAFAQKINLWQKEYFSISLINSTDNSEKWLHGKKTLIEEGVHNESKLRYKLKYFKRPKKLMDPVAINLYYIHIKLLVTSNYYPTSHLLALRLAALSLQVNHGDFNPTKLNYFNEETVGVLIPSTIFSSAPFPYLQWRILSYYSRFKGLKAEEAKAKYLEIASSIPLWGVTLYQVTDKQSGSVAKRVLGIAEDGILVSKGWSLLSIKDHKDCYDFYPFEKLSKWNVTSDGIEIHIHNSESLAFSTTFPFPGVKDEIYNLLNDYYVMLSFEKPSDLSKKEHIDYSLYKQEQLYPDYRLYFPPVTRKLIDPHYSRLEHFRFCYLEECKATSNVPILKLLQQVDSLQESHKNFQSLELSGCNLRWEQLDIVAKSITKVFKYMGSPEHKYEENMTLTNIDISNNPSAGSEAVNSIGLFLLLPIPLNNLNISNMSLGPKGAQDLAPLLEQNKVVENLSIASNNLGSKGASVLLNAIRRNKNYTFINISNNDLDSKFVNDVRDFFLSHITLKGISISANKLGEPGGVILATALWEVINFASLETLELNDVGMGTELKKVLNWVSKNKSLRNLAIGYNKLPDSVATKIAKVLASPECRLSKLDIKMCDISSKPLEEIAKSLASNSSLEAISLSGNVLKKKAGMALSKSLITNKSIKILSLRSCSIQKVTFVSILQALLQHPIERLDISGNKEAASTEVATEIGRMISLHASVQAIDISSCEISHHGVALISAGIFRSSALKSLCMDSNKIGKDIVKLAEALRSDSCKLEELTLRSCDITPPVILDFFTCLAGGQRRTKESKSSISGSVSRKKDKKEILQEAESIQVTSVKLKTLFLDGNGLKSQDFGRMLKLFPELSVTF